MSVIGVFLVMHGGLGVLLIAYSLIVDRKTYIYQPLMLRMAMHESQWSFLAGGFMVVVAFTAFAVSDLTRRTPPSIESGAAGER